MGCEDWKLELCSRKLPQPTVSVNLSGRREGLVLGLRRHSGTQGWHFHCRCDGCEAVLLGIEQQVLRANQYKENHHRTQQQVEAEVKRRGHLFLS